MEKQWQCSLERAIEGCIYYIYIFSHASLCMYTSCLYWIYQKIFMCTFYILSQHGEAVAVIAGEGHSRRKYEREYERSEVYMYIYTSCICIYVYICICNCIHTIQGGNMRGSMSALRYYIRAYVYINIYVYLYIYIYIYVYIYMYTFMYIYIYISYIYIYIYLY
jgi:hypothetical protein